MEHTCTNWDCQHVEFNNESQYPAWCPECGARMQHHFDEQPEPRESGDGPGREDEREVEA